MISRIGLCLAAAFGLGGALMTAQGAPDGMFHPRTIQEYRKLAEAYQVRAHDDLQHARYYHKMGDTAQEAAMMANAEDEARHARLYAQRAGSLGGGTPGTAAHARPQRRR